MKALVETGTAADELEVRGLAEALAGSGSSEAADRRGRHPRNGSRWRTRTSVGTDACQPPSGFTSAPARCVVRCSFALHEPDEHWDELWRRGAGGMTVFGFDRGPKPQWQYLDHAPAQLTVGLIEDSRFAAARRAIESAWRPLEVRVGD